MHGRLLTRLRPDSGAWLVAACVAAGTALVLAREWKFGVALHLDSVLYISVARSLLAGEGFMQVVGGPMDGWPPLYPLLLAAASLFVFDPHAVAGPLNAVIFGLTVLLVGHWLRQRLESRWLALWACLATMLSLPLVREASWAMTEPLFILTATLSLTHLDRFLREGRDASLLWAAAFAALTCLTRYIGVALVAATALLLILQQGAVPLQKAKRIALHSLVALAPVCLWMARNYLLVGHITGLQPSVTYSISPTDFLVYVLAVLASWLHPEWISMEITLAAQGALLAFCVALAAATAHLIIRAPAHWRGFCVFSAFALTYLGTLAAVMLGVSWTFLDPRYLTPLCLPILLMSAFAADNLLKRSWAKGRVGITRHAAKLALLTPLYLWLGYSATLQAGHIRQWLADSPERSLTNSKWTRSQTIQYMQKAPREGPIYSNEVIPLYIHSDPTKEYHRLRPQEDQLRRLAENAESGAYIVWFYDDWWIGRNFRYNDFHLRALPNAEVAADLFDGLVLRLQPSGEFDDDAYQARQAERANAVINSAGRKAINSNFAVHIDQDALTYIKKSCTKADTTAKFFLHIWPAAKRDLPQHRRSYGHDNLDLEFDRRGFRFAGRCAARINLPEYRMVRIATGQWETGKGKIWKGEIDFP